MDKLDLDQKCREIESKIVSNADLIQLLKERFSSDEINDEDLRILQSSLAIVLDVQNDIFKKFTELPL